MNKTLLSISFALICAISAGISPARAETTAQINYSIAPTTVTQTSKVKSTGTDARNFEVGASSAFSISKNEKLLVQGTIENLSTPAYEASVSGNLPSLSDLYAGIGYAHLNGLGGLGYGLTYSPTIGTVTLVGSSFLYPNIGGQYRLIKSDVSAVVGATGKYSFVLGFKQDRSVPLKGFSATFDTYGPYVGIRTKL